MRSRLGLVVGVRSFLSFFLSHHLSLRNVHIMDSLALQFNLMHFAAGEGQEHLPLLDNISWKSISLKLGTRNENMAGFSLCICSLIPHPHPTQDAQTIQCFDSFRQHTQKNKNKANDTRYTDMSHAL